MDVIRALAFSLGVEAPPEAQLLVIDGHGVVDDTCSVGMPPLLDGASMAVLVDDQLPEMPDRDQHLDEFDSLRHLPPTAFAQQLQSFTAEALAQRPALMEGIERLRRSSESNMRSAISAILAALPLPPPHPRPAHRHVQLYHEPSVRRKILSVVPVAQLAREAAECPPHPHFSSPRDALLFQLLRWCVRPRLVASSLS